MFLCKIKGKATSGYISGYIALITVLTISAFLMATILGTSKTFALLSEYVHVLHARQQALLSAYTCRNLALVRLSETGGVMEGSVESLFVASITTSSNCSVGLDFNSSSFGVSSTSDSSSLYMYTLISKGWYVYHGLSHGVKSGGAPDVISAQVRTQVEIGQDGLRILEEHIL